jgi:hypothetical protein
MEDNRKVLVSYTLMLTTAREQEHVFLIKAVNVALIFIERLFPSELNFACFCSS